MTTGPQHADPRVPRQPPTVRRHRDLRRLSPTAALAEMIDRVLSGASVASADVANELHGLGGIAASALLDAGDLRAWELTTCVAAEVTALARIGGIPPEPP